VNEARLQALIAELDELVPRSGAVVWEDHGLYGSELDPSYGGNRAGYLRLGIEFLKIAEAPPVPGRPTRVHADLSYLVNGERERGEPAIFERRDVSAAELISAREPPGRLGSTLALGAIAVVGLALLVLLVLGLRDVAGWLRAS